MWSNEPFEKNQKQDMIHILLY